MADAALHVTHKTRVRGRDAFIIVNAGVVFAGSLVQLSAGYLDDWDDAGAGSTFLGLCDGGADRAGDGVLTGNTSDAPPPEAKVITSGDTVQHLASIDGTPAQAKVGDLVYCPTSNLDDLDLQASGNTDPVGWLIRFRSTTDCDVQFFTPTEFLAQQTA